MCVVVRHFSLVTDKCKITLDADTGQGLCNDARLGAVTDLVAVHVTCCRECSLGADVGQV